MLDQKKKRNKKSHLGICRLCKQKKELTFEHIPPKAVFNNNPVLQYDGNEVLNNPEAFLNNELRYTKKRRGSGFYYLCRDCNSFTGGKYNKKYEQVANTFGAIIRGNSNNHTTGICLRPIDIAWNSFFRQAMVMFVNICDLCSNDDNLRDYLLYPECNQFNTQKYRLFIYAVNYHHKKMTRIIGNIQIDNLHLKAFPLGMLLLIDEDLSIEKKFNKKEFEYLGVDITDFSKFPYDYEFQISMTIPMHYADDAESILETFKGIQEAMFLRDAFEKGKIIYE